MAPGEAKTSANSRVKIAVALAEGVVTGGTRLGATAFQVHVAEVALNTEHQPIPLEVVTNLTSRDHSGFVVAPGFGSVEEVRNPKVIVIVLVFSMSPLAADVQTDIEAGPGALRWRCRCNLFHFLSAGQRLRSAERGQCQGKQSASGNRQTSQLFHEPSFRQKYPDRQGRFPSARLISTKRNPS